MAWNKRSRSSIFYMERFLAAQIESFRHESFQAAMSELTSPVWLSIEHYPNKLRYVMFADERGNSVTATYVDGVVTGFTKRTAMLHMRHG